MKPINIKQVLLLLAVLFAVDTSSGQTNRLPAVQADGPRPAEQELSDWEQAWATAVQQRDTVKIDHILAGEFVFTDPGGRLWTKTREMEDLKSGSLLITAFTLSEQQIRRYENTAVVTQLINWTGAYNGTDISGPQRTTDVLVKRDGRWQCVASQSTRIPSQTTNPHP